MKILTFGCPEAGRSAFVSGQMSSFFLRKFYFFLDKIVSKSYINNENDFHYL